ncbi:MAG: glycoside hydrolase family 2 TIM barrel-domain containing protein [Isosphaeraceae bacterium]|nr:glycoside hydrolase family 2 TIM barrel-domain containing protein [Isosphaeraceae bacterium]
MRRILAFLLVCSASLRTGAAEIPRPEHPRPDAVRKHWLNLNGTWKFRFDPQDRGLSENWQSAAPAGFDRSIVVPFPWESELSGLGAPPAAKVGWYQRTLEIPADFPSDQRVVLHFGAVDWRAEVWIDGKVVGEHEGGYSPFSIDITEHVASRKPASLVVRVFDPTDPELPTGKQVGWYTPTSGIWQTVWLEARPAAQIRDFSLVTDLESVAAAVEIVAPIAGEYRLVATSKDADFRVESKVRAEAGAKTRIDLRGKPKTPRLWTPDDPHLSDLTLELMSPDGKVDSVDTYFGLRTIARGKFGDEPYERILLNGKPIYLRTALDQSFNPKGIYTAPDDDFLKRDLLLSKVMGLNGLRIHIKPDEPRRLYWADKMGVLILADMPNTWRQSPRARKAWEAGMREIVARDKNHPSIIAWIAFNETWGLGSPEEYKKDVDTQQWVKRMVSEIRALDPTRLVEDNSPCNYDHVAGTDINSWHFYIDDHADARKHIADVVDRTKPGSNFNYCPGELQSTAPLINSEYGSVSAGGGDRDVSWGFRDLTTQLRRHPKIQGYVYTELTDIEWEHNGFADYDRSLKQFGYEHFLPDMRPNELNGDDFVGYDAPPAIVGRPGEVIRVPVFISHFSNRTFEPKLRYWVDGVDDNGDVAMIVTPKSIPAKWTRYGVVEQQPIEIRLPAHPFVGALCLTLRDPENRRFAANFVNIVVKENAVRAERSPDDEHDSYLRFRPDDFASARWSGPSAVRPGKVWGQGAGWFEYRIQIPAALLDAGIESFFLRAELAPRAGVGQVDWNSRRNPQDQPQTDARKAPTSLRITLGDQTLPIDELEDDRADARGVLSHLARVEHGSHGDLVEAMIQPSAELLAKLKSGEPLRVRLEVPENAPHRGGLSVYGAESGMYPFDPVIHIHTKEVPPVDLGVDVSAPVARDRRADRIRPLITGVASASKPTVWSYLADAAAPPADWTTPEFDDSAWKKGYGGFGTEGTPGIALATEWKSPLILLRTRINLPKLGKNDQLGLRLIHDEDVAIFVNGKPLLQRRGYVTGYVDIGLAPEQVALFREGVNTIAVSCRQTRGGQGIDLGLTLLPEAP